MTKTYKVTVNGHHYDVTVEDGKVISAGAAVERTQEVESKKSSQGVVITGTRPGVIISPLPGVIIRLNVNVGDKVKAGQNVATLEAMKMENAIEAEFDGIVKAIHVHQGESVLEGTKIVTIE